MPTTKLNVNNKEIKFFISDMFPNDDVTMSYEYANGNKLEIGKVRKNNVGEISLGLSRDGEDFFKKIMTDGGDLVKGAWNSINLSEKIIAEIEKTRQNIITEKAGKYVESAEEKAEFFDDQYGHLLLNRR